MKQEENLVLRDFEKTQKAGFEKIAQIMEEISKKQEEITQLHEQRIEIIKQLKQKEHLAEFIYWLKLMYWIRTGKLI